MNGFGQGVRPAYKTIQAWLDSSDPENLKRLQKEAEFLFRRIGITFAVYGDAEAEERIIPFDIVPRVLTGREWTTLSKGLTQRVTALNRFLADVYGAGEIIRAGVVPADLVYQNPAFRPEMVGLKLPHDVYVQIAGIDVIRTDDKDFSVLEDNARTPSGVSYMLENRDVQMRLFPDLFAETRIQPVDNYPDELLASLRSLAPASAPAEPTVVLMTPGPLNSAYYEHAFLADMMGVELVEGSDLRVIDGKVKMRSTRGYEAIDVLFRRVDDDFRLKLIKHLIQRRFVANRTDAQDDRVLDNLAVLVFQLGKQVIHVVFADVVQHQLFGNERHHLPAHLRPD